MPLNPPKPSHRLREVLDESDKVFLAGSLFILNLRRNEAYSPLKIGRSLRGVPDGDIYWTVLGFKE